MEEIWKDIEGYEGLYQVSNLGRVKVLAKIISGKGGRKRKVLEGIRKSVKLKNGYYKLILSKNGESKDFYIHVLVYYTFSGDSPKKGMQINHIDGDKSNNNLSNLELVTRSENMFHAYNIGLRKRGQDLKGSKLKNEDVVKIKELIKTKTNVDISLQFNVNKNTIRDIKKGITWKHL